MQTVLFVNELGAGLGHMNRLAGIAELLDPGYRVVFAANSPELGISAIGRKFGGRAELVRGFTWPPPVDPAAARRAITNSLADALILFRLGDMEAVQMALERWRQVLRTVRPSLIVSDFSPGVALVAGSSIPIMVVGNGYSIPPGGRLLPPIRPWHQAVPARSRANEARILEVANRIRTRMRTACVDFVADLFQGARTFVSTIEVFDPYRNYRTAPSIPPLNLPIIPQGNPISERSDQRIFVYLPKDHIHLRSALAALGSVGLPTEVYLGGGRVETLDAPPNIAFRSESIDYALVLPEIKLLVHHGGLGTASAALLAGVPQLCLPIGLEQLITSRAAESMGAAKTVAQRDANPHVIEAALRCLLADQRIHAAAAAASVRIRNEERISSRSVIANALNELLGAASTP
jgi:rhamnosyltransferase subunit B